MALTFPNSSKSAESTLAVINAGVSSVEDAPFVAPGYHFSPGDYLYCTFEVAGFGVRSANRGETRSISLEYQASIEDGEGRPLAPPVSDEIQTELSPEDKNWVPKRRASFLLPSFVAAGSFHLRISIKDLVAKAEVARDVPFLMGGIELKPTTSVGVQSFEFLRTENDAAALEVPAFSPGDTVFARFDIVGFRTGPGNQHHVAYGVTVFGPDGKPVIQDPHAADLQSESFYPAQFIPGNVALKMGKNNTRGTYTVVLTVRDLLANQSLETKQAFSLE